MIKFIEKEEVEQLTFGDVSVNQFFVNEYGFLCQKLYDYKSVAIADPTGIPWSDILSIDSHSPIRRIINIERIEF